MQNALFYTDDVLLIADNKEKHWELLNKTHHFHMIIKFKYSLTRNVFYDLDRLKTDFT